METVATTRMSSKGQVVIPETIRKRLNLEEGTQFVVVGDADVIILKSISRPDPAEFDALIQQARQQAKTAAVHPFRFSKPGKRSKVIVRGDKHLLNVSGYQGIQVLKPRAFVERYLD